jgi:hypothetical protein
MGGVVWGKELCGGATKVIDLKLDQFAVTLDCTPTILTGTEDDSTHIFLSATAPCTSKQTSHIPLNVNMPNGTSIKSSHTCDLLLTALPPQATKPHALPGFVHKLLISAGQLCDSGCDVTFKKEQVSVKKERKCMMLGS